MLKRKKVELEDSKKGTGLISDLKFIKKYACDYFLIQVANKMIDYICEKEGLDPERFNS